MNDAEKLANVIEALKTIRAKAQRALDPRDASGPGPYGTLESIVGDIDNIFEIDLAPQPEAE